MLELCPLTLPHSCGSNAISLRNMNGIKVGKRCTAKACGSCRRCHPADQLQIKKCMRLLYSEQAAVVAARLCAYVCTFSASQDGAVVPL